MESKTLVILINDFGWDFLANDLPECSGLKFY